MSIWQLSVDHSEIRSKTKAVLGNRCPHMLLHFVRRTRNPSDTAWDYSERWNYSGAFSDQFISPCDH